jgi:hypothetical protein
MIVQLHEFLDSKFSVEIHEPAVLSCRKEPEVPTGWEVGCNSDSVWTWWRKENFLPGNESGHSSHKSWLNSPSSIFSFSRSLLYIKKFCKRELYHCHRVISGYHSNELLTHCIKVDYEVTNEKKQCFVSMYRIFSMSINNIVTYPGNARSN